MRKTILIILSLVATVMALSAATPDFAYPQTVIADCEKRLSSLDGSAGQKADISRAECLLDIVYARGLVDQQSYFNAPALVDSVARQITDPAVRALVHLIDADIYSSIYNASAYRYDQVKTPDQPLPADISEWNGRQFRAVIDSLVNEAVALDSVAGRQPLADFSAVITADAAARYLYPTVYDFIALKVSGLTQNGDAAAPMRRALARTPRRSAPWFNWQVKILQGMLSFQSRRGFYINGSDLDINPKLKSLYYSNNDCEASGIVLMALLDNIGQYRKKDAKELQSLKDYIAAYPEFLFINSLKNNLTRLTTRKVSITAPVFVNVDTPAKLSVNYNFTDKAGYVVYKYPYGVDNITKTDMSKYYIKKDFIDVSADEGDCDTVMTLRLKEPGVYYVVASDSPVATHKNINNGCRVVVTPFIPAAICGQTYDIFFMSFADGRPVKDVEAYYKKRGKSAVTKIGISDSDGMIKVGRKRSRSLDDGYATFRYKGVDFGDRFTLCLDKEMEFLVKDSIEAGVGIFTDRKLYHLGDSVGWAVLLYGAAPVNKFRPQVQNNRSVKVVMYDVNDQFVDSLTVETDDYGRGHGFFKLPDQGLTGDYSLKAYNVDFLSKNNLDVTKKQYISLGECGLTVSDFKLKTFKVEIVAVNRNCPAEGDVTLKGKVMTFTGMPVADANVVTDIHALAGYGWNARRVFMNNVETKSDADGMFEIVVDHSMTGETKYNNYSCYIKVSTSNGESALLQKSVSTGKPYKLTCYLNRKKCFNTDSVTQISVGAENVEGNPVDIPLIWTLKPESKDSNIVASGECSSTKGISADFSDLDAGDYILSVCPVDTAMADSIDASIKLYSIARNVMPETTKAFFVPEENKITTAKDGTFTVLIGTAGHGKTYMYSVFNGGNDIGHIEQKELEYGFHRLSYKLEDNCDEGRLYIFTVRDGVNYTEEFNVIRGRAEAPEISIVSFRDKLSPGAKESWTLNFKYDGVSSQGAMVATMYNSAIDQIKNYFWPFFYFPERVFSMNYQSVNRYSMGKMSSEYYKYNKYLEEVRLIAPVFNPQLTYYGLQRMRMYKSANRVTAAGGVVEEEVEMADNAVYAASDMSAKITPVGGGYAMPEDGGPVVNKTDRPDNFEYREGEVLQAFWKPDLTFDAEGNSVISFTVPDANATWSFRAFAWTKDVSTATLFKEIISNKPVMVTPQLPRFLRAGDKARLIANVFNNSDSTITVTSVVEVFDTNSGTVTRSVTSTDTIAPMASTSVSIEVAADGNASAIGYRVRSTSGRFSDGEQDYIAVMPSTSDVIESDNFYLNPGESDYSVRLPKGKMESVTLEYNASPAWEVIKQLPALAVCESYTSTGAARRLFGAAVSSGLLKKYPALARAIETWSADSASQALVSRLSQNEDLKTAALTETPWVQAAQSDSERMARLVALLDSKAVARNMAASINKLKTLKAADGGWRWGEWESKGNAWSTRSTLYSLGQLNAIGMMPADKELRAMIESAFAFLDVKSAKIYPDLGLSAILAMFPDHELSLKERQIVNATTAYINKEYRKFGTAEKARAAIVLDAFGYKAMARQLMESVAQFGVSSKDKGTSFPSVTNVDSYADLLFAFARIEPQSSAIDGMRQWLVVRGQATSRLGSFDPTRLIAAFEMTGSDWNVSGAAPTVTLGGEAVSVGSVEPVTGHLIAQLPTDASGKKLAVVRDNAAGPAYGAVISRYVSASADVKAVKCDGLSIEKRLTVQRGDRWEYADSLRLGDRVRVLLTIKADRDLEYVTVIDERPASFEPVSQLPGYVYSAGLGFYRENNDTDTRLFVGYMPKGTYQITTEMTVGFAGEFTSGIATAQSSLDPSITAHSSGRSLICR